METNSMLTSIFGCVLKSSWQAAALVCLVLIVQGILGRNLSARWRYGLWFLVLVRLLVPVLPESAFSIYNLAKTSASSASGRERPAFELLTRGNERKAVSELSAVSQMPLFPEASAPLPQPKKSVRLWTWLIGLWVSGATMLAGCFAWQIVRFNRRVRRYGCLDDARVHSILEEAKLSVGLKTAVQLVETCETPVPAMFGLIRPRLLLPADFRKDYSEHELRLVFLHELTHLKRRDHVVNWMMLVLSTIHWFNPLVWLAFGRMRADRELACDEQVLTVSPDHQNKSYGQMLIKLLEGLPQPARLPGLIGIVENTHQLKRRITMIAKFKRPARWSALLALPVIALGFITLTDAQTKTERPDKEVIAEIEKLSGKVTYDETRADRPVIGVDFFINDEDWWKSKVPRLKVTDNMLKRLEALKELEDLDLTDAQISDEGLACLQGLTRLRKLSLLSTKITGSGLRYLKGLTNLKELDLWDTQVTDAELGHVRDLSNLEVLRLNAARNLSDAGLENVARLSKLRELGLGATAITDNGLVHLKGLVNLEKLELWRTKIGDAGLAHLKNLTKLKHLELNRARITDASWVILSGFTNLTYLRISGTEITDAGLVRLKSLPQLETLDLGGAKQVTDMALRQLQDLPKLKVVGLNNGIISEAGLSALDNRPPLEITTASYREPFTLSGPTITDSSLVHLKRLTKLKSLALRNTKMSEQGISQLSEIPGLEVLHLTGPEVTDSMLAHLQELPDLKGLFLADTHVSDAGLGHLKKLKKLSVLDLVRTKITDIGLEHLSGMSGLSYLVLKTTEVSDAGLVYLKNLRNLDQLDLSNTRVSDAGITHLTDLQELNYLFLAGTHITDAGLVQLKKLSKLVFVQVQKTQVTAAGIEALKKDRPDLEVGQ